MAKENPGWGYDRIVGAMANLGLLFGMLSLVAQFVYWSRIVSGLNQEHA